jgi:hypothetical protein
MLLQTQAIANDSNYLKFVISHLFLSLEDVVDVH